MEYTKLDPAVKKEWVDALRSGEYEQGRSMLRDPTDRFCCLGVLCSLGHVELPESGWGGNYPPMRSMPGALTQESPTPHNSVYHFLAARNDEDWDFLQIADWIEKNL